VESKGKRHLVDAGLGSNGTYTKIPKQISISALEIKQINKFLIPCVIKANGKHSRGLRGHIYLLDRAKTPKCFAKVISGPLDFHSRVADRRRNSAFCNMRVSLSSNY